MAAFGPTNSYRFGKGHLTLNEKKIILNVYKSVCTNFPNLNKVELLDKTAEFTGRCSTTIKAILKEERSTNTLSQPKVGGSDQGIVLDEHEKYLLRKIVHSFFLKNEPPRLRTILAEVAKNEELSRKKFGKTKLHEILTKELNFSFKSRSRNSVLIERPEIISWRRRFLREVKDLRRQGRPIFYLDETWVNAGHTETKVWTDGNILSARKAFNEGLSTGLKNPSGKGKRLIILHIGSADGFVEGGLLLFEGIKTGDYHEEMNGERFEEWFRKMMDLLPRNAVIVMDNAKYHSRLMEGYCNHSKIRN